jgi:hypothetical protein
VRVIFDPDEQPADSDAAYSPRALPGMEDAATPIQGLLWADVSGGKWKAESKPDDDARPDQPPLFE